MSIESRIADACRAVGIVPPAKRLRPGRWTPCPAEGKPASNTAGRVWISHDGGSGVAWNWITGAAARFRDGSRPPVAPETSPLASCPSSRAEAERHAEVAAICERIVRACRIDRHPYLAAKGFAEEPALTIGDVAQHLPRTPTGDAIRRGLPEGDGPWLVVPGRVGARTTTVQLIGPDGTKRNIWGGRMAGASHRLTTGRDTWIAEGIATALSVRDALRLLGRSATVRCAFAAANVARVARAIPNAVVAADRDRPLEQLGGLGTGEFYARASGCRWTMPPALGDFNDMHQREGLRAVALRLREMGRT